MLAYTWYHTFRYINHTEVDTVSDEVFVREEALCEELFVHVHAYITSKQCKQEVKDFPCPF